MIVKVVVERFHPLKVTDSDTGVNKEVDELQIPIHLCIIWSGLIQRSYISLILNKQAMNSGHEDLF